jgi:hypothetical protein
MSRQSISNGLLLYGIVSIPSLALIVTPFTPSIVNILAGAFAPTGLAALYLRHVLLRQWRNEAPGRASHSHSRP